MNRAISIRPQPSVPLDPREWKHEIQPCSSSHRDTPTPTPAPTPAKKSQTSPMAKPTKFSVSPQATPCYKVTTNPLLLVIALLLSSCLGDW